MFDDLKAKWLAAGGKESKCITRECWELIEQNVSAHMRTIETGSGLSTLLFEAVGCCHTALENHQPTASLVNSCLQDTHARVTVSKLAGFPAWYTMRPTVPCDFLFIDGPAGGNPSRPGRWGIMRELSCFISRYTTIVIDDIDRSDDCELAIAIAKSFDMVVKAYHAPCAFGTDGIKKFALLRRTDVV